MLTALSMAILLLLGPDDKNEVQLHLLGQDDRNEVQHDIFGHVMPLALVLVSHAADDIIDGTIASLGQDN